MKRRVLSCLIAASLVASGLVVNVLPTSAGAETPSASRPAPPAVQMTCSPGQFDINAQDPSLISSALGIDPAVAQRLVSQGPWLQPRDLLSVQGIGAGWLAANKSRLCALPTATPPVTSNPCQGLKVDIQTSTAVVLQNAFGLNTSSASKMVAARPYQSLSQISPDRVPGLGSSSQARVLKDGCLTPPTIATSGATWRWAYADTTTTDQRGKFALTVPAGTITSPGGAWLSITDTASSDPLAGPTADFHIWGSWANQGSNSVQVTGPAEQLDFTPESPWVDVVIHYASNGPVFAGPGATTVDNGNGTVTISVDSLSKIEWRKLPITFLQIINKATWTGNESLEALVRWFLGLNAHRPTCDPDITTDPNIKTSGDARNPVDINGDFNSVPVKFCVERVPSASGQPDTAKWKIANNLGTVIRLSSPGGLIVGRDHDSTIGEIFAETMTSSSVRLEPGGVAFVQVRQGDPAAAVGVNVADRGSLLAAFLVRTAERLLPPSLDVYAIIKDCVQDLKDFPDLLSALNCTASAALRQVSELPKGSPKSAAMKAAAKVLNVVSTAISTNSNWVSHHANSTSATRLRRQRQRPRPRPHRRRVGPNGRDLPPAPM